MKQLDKVAKIDPDKLPTNKIYCMKDARLLAKGQYKHIDEDDNEGEKLPILHGENERVNLNRAMLTGTNDPQHEIALDNFEEAVANALVDHDINKMFGSAGDPRNFKDNVPEDLRKTLKLPKDMQNYEIDFDEVRRDDAQFKRRKPVWSGQEVLDLTLNMHKSGWVIMKLNKLRVWPKGFYNVTKKFRAVLKTLIRFSLFDNFLTICVLMNTVVMGMESYDIDLQTQQDLEFLNIIFTWIFIVEMCIKLLAIGPQKYSSNVMNLLDGGVVLLSIVEIAMAAAGGGGGAGNLQAFRTVRVFRTFRVLRVTRVLRALKSMAMVIGVI